MYSQPVNDIVTLHVSKGDKMVTFKIHKKIPCHKIEYFKNFDGTFSGAITQ
jgi:hypothetical protein